ncbi:MAG: hypothetical protein EHM21_17775, partial [Chloroflexi bacterium]
MSWKPAFKLRDKHRPDARAKTTEPESSPEAAWLRQVIVRTVAEADLPGMEWDGEYTHFRRMYAEAYQRMRRGYTVLWVAELPGTGLVGQVFIQLVCDRPELADGQERAYLYSFRVRSAYRGQG